MRTDALDFTLPPDRIATTPAEPRDSAKLLVMDRAADALSHRRVRDLPELLQPGDLLIVNQSKVLPAWFQATRAATAGRMSGLFLHEPATNQWDVLLESRGKLQPHETITLTDAASLTLLKNTGPGRWLTELHAPCATLDLLQQIGSPPLPPYIRKARKKLNQPELETSDPDRYNTVYAQDPGSVAAPTAGLHFTPDLLQQLDQRGVGRAHVTLHVGLGTFAPVKADTLEQHDIHHEPIHVPADTLRAIQQCKTAGRRVVCVGTTTVRALESVPDEAFMTPRDITLDTDLFITPDSGFTFRVTDALMTNFHLPRSTLLALVAALPHVGLPRLLAAYEHAIAHEYRFYSYGDAMLIL